MKTKFFKQWLCLLLAILMTLSTVSCKNGNNDNEDPTETKENVVASTPYPFVPTDEYVIVRGDLYASDGKTTDACYHLKKAIEKAYGITLNIVTDQTEAKGKKEFLVGPTNRAFSKQMSETLALNDYAYYVPTSSAIVICGATPDKTLEAVEKFCEDVLTYDGKKVQKQDPEITTLTKYNHAETYDYTTVTINNILCVKVVFC